jgi:hypothetical protein
MPHVLGQTLEGVQQEGHVLLTLLLMLLVLLPPMLPL